MKDSSHDQDEGGDRNNNASFNVADSAMESSASSLAIPEVRDVNVHVLPLKKRKNVTTTTTANESTANSVVNSSSVLDADTPRNAVFNNKNNGARKKIRDATTASSHLRDHDYSGNNNNNNDEDAKSTPRPNPQQLQQQQQRGRAPVRQSLPRHQRLSLPPPPPVSVDADGFLDAGASGIHIVGRLTQIKDYIAQTSAMINRLSASTIHHNTSESVGGAESSVATVDHLEDVARLEELRSDLRQQEGVYLQVCCVFLLFFSFF